MGSYSISWDNTTCTFIASGVPSGTAMRFIIRHEPEISSDPVVDTIVALSSSYRFAYGGLVPGTSYAVNAGTALPDGRADWFNTKYFTTSQGGGGGGTDIPDIPTPVRPSDWAWWSVIDSGAAINISASEWNAFCDRINEFRSYKGFDEITFSRVYRGTAISAAIVNEARNAIYPMSNWVPYAVSQGDIISASFFLGLQTALNAIP